MIMFLSDGGKSDRITFIENGFTLTTNSPNSYTFGINDRSAVGECTKNYVIKDVGTSSPYIINGAMINMLHATGITPVLLPTDKTAT